VEALRILLVDDFEPYRRFVLSELRPLTEVEVIGHASDGLEAVQRAEKLQPDLILLDVGLPLLNGIEVCQRIRQVSPHSKILFLSQDSSPDVVEEALRLGAQGYVLKSDAARELVSAIRAIRQGKLFVSRRLEAEITLVRAQ
jgi:DNA-binding NarL/FixJ family response regulator